MRMKIPTLIVIAIVIAAVASILALRREPTPDIGDISIQADSSLTAPPTVPLTGAPPDRVAGERREPAAQEVEVIAAAPEAVDLLEELDGNVVVAALDGQVWFPEKGYIVWEITNSESGGLRDGRSSVRTGAWSLALAEGELARPLKIIAGIQSRTYACDYDMEQVYSLESGYPTIEAYMRMGATLEVLDAATGEHLKGVTICQATSACGDFSETFCVPPLCVSEDSAVQRGDSPVAMPQRKGVIACWAHAPGYQWKAFAVGADSRAVTVELNKGASVRVKVVGLDPVYQGAAAIFYPGNFDPNAVDGGVPNIPLAVRSVAGGDEVQIAGLPVGKCSIRVAMSPNASSVGPWLAQASVSLAPGDNGLLSIDVNDSQVQQGLARVEVKIPRDIFGSRIPPMVGVVLERPGSALNQKYSDRPLERYLDGGSAFVQGQATLEAAGLPVGEYLATLMPLGVTRSVSLRSDRVNVIDFAESPAMIEATVRVTGEEGEALSTASISIGHPESTAGVTLREIRDMTGPTGTASFWWPKGPVRVVVKAPSYDGVIIDTELRVHGEAVEVQLHKADEERFSIVEFHRNGERLTLPLPFWSGTKLEGVGDASGARAVRLQPLGPQVGGLQLHDGHGVKLHVTAVGDYRLTSPKLPGCPVIEDQRISLGSGDTVVIEVSSVL